MDGDMEPTGRNRREQMGTQQASRWEISTGRNGAHIPTSEDRHSPHRGAQASSKAQAGTGSGQSQGRVLGTRTGDTTCTLSPGRANEGSYMAANHLSDS